MLTRNAGAVEIDADNDELTLLILANSFKLPIDITMDGLTFKDSVCKDDQGL